MRAPLHTVLAYIQQLGEGITAQQVTITVILSLITMTVVWLGQECSYLKRKLLHVDHSLRCHAARLDKLQAKVDDVGWRDSRLLTQFDWRQPSP